MGDNPEQFAIILTNVTQLGACQFYRVRNHGHDDIEGNGLGLAIVKSIAQQQGADVSVESKVGEGSCFVVSLPLVLAPEV